MIQWLKGNGRLTSSVNGVCVMHSNGTWYTNDFMISVTFVDGKAFINHLLGKNLNSQI